MRHLLRICRYRLLISYVRLVRRVVVEVSLDEDDRGALVAGAAGQVAQGADQVGELTRRCAF